MVEVIVNGKYLEGGPKNIKYIKQANDLADVTTVNSSYLYSLDFPKTSNNTLIFEGLGLVGDTSTIPYRKNTTQVIDNGSMIVSNGVSTVKETSKVYKLIIQDGIIDFFRAIENKSIGNDLDLSEISHKKNVSNIIASFTNPFYRYLIAEYNGKTLVGNNINPDYQVPSANNLYLFDKIMEFAGYTYEGLPDISIDWTTYTSVPAEVDDEEVLRFDASINNFYQNIDVIADFVPQWETPILYDTTVVQLQNNWRIKVLEIENYKLELNLVNSEMRYVVFEGNIRHKLWMPLKFLVYKNNNLIGQVISTDNKTLIVPAATNDIFDFRMTPLTAREAIDAGIDDPLFIEALGNGNYTNDAISIELFNTKISTIGVEIFDFSDAFKDFSMTEFVKEIFFRKSLTAFTNVDERHIKFKTLTERLSVENAIDWTSKYVERTKEEYSFGSYAKINNLLLKHDDEEDTFGNGFLAVDNDNLKDNITLLQSKYLAPDEVLRLIGSFSGFFLFLKFWDRNVKDNNGTIEIEYKPLSNRFFLLREEWVNKTLRIGDETVTGYPKATMNGTTMSDVVGEYYSDWGKIFDDLRIHDIDLMLNQFDVNGLVMDEPYWFEQEGTFYLLNRLMYESGKLTGGEFLKIKI